LMATAAPGETKAKRAGRMPALQGTNGKRAGETPAVQKTGG
jgi:hypothetical protein